MVCRFVRMQRRWGENVGGRAKPLCGLLLVVSLVVIVVILLQPKLSFLPQHYSVAVLSVTINATLNSQDSRPIFTVFHNAAPPWDRLATFYILTSLKDDRSVSAMLAQTVGDCRGLPVDGTLSLTCQKPSDIYLLYSNSDELQAAQVAVNATRFSSGITTKPIYRQINTQKAVREINSVMLDAYLDGVNYFRLVLTNGTLGTGFESVARLDRLPVRQHGVIAEVSSSTSALAALSFSSQHFDIFGWFLPLESPSVMMASQIVCDLYASRGWLHVFRGASDVTNSAWPNASIAQEHLNTLDRYMLAFRNSSCWRCVSRDSDVKVISMSLYGAGKRYTVGAIRNAQLQAVNYPGWRLWIHCEPFNTTTKYPVVPGNVIRRLEELGAEFRFVNLSISSTVAPMLWRFRVATDPQVSMFIVRDADGRLTPRDAAVVSDWLRHPEAYFHCIRDHPSHSLYAVSGGLWGGRPAQLVTAADGKVRQVFDEAMGKYGAGYMEDMNFLCQVVWPQVKDSAYCHDSFSCDRYPASHPFLVQRIGSEHLGEVYDEFSVGRQGDIDILVRAAVNRKCVP